MYIPLLQNKTYHNLGEVLYLVIDLNLTLPLRLAYLDEAGDQIEKRNVFEDGRHAIAGKIMGWADNNQKPLNRGQDWKDHCFIDDVDCADWAGAVRWFRGSLQIIHGSPEFPPGRELMFFHRPLKSVDFPDKFKEQIFDDMMTYGFLLPGWFPLMSQYMCLPESNKQESTVDLLKSYQPYSPHCNQMSKLAS